MLMWSHRWKQTRARVREKKIRLSSASFYYHVKKSKIRFVAVYININIDVRGETAAGLFFIPISSRYSQKERYAI